MFSMMNEYCYFDFETKKQKKKKKKKKTDIFPECKGKCNFSNNSINVPYYGTLHSQL